MSKHDDWFDDFMMIKMLEEDSHRGNHTPTENSGCLPGILLGICILLILQLLG